MSEIVCYIDLTTPLTYLKDTVINLDSDESLIEVIPTTTSSSTTTTSSSATTSTVDNSHPSKASLSKSNKSHQSYKKKTRSKSSILKEISTEIENKNFGQCPICWDDLGKNPLASTKCGHVFCIACLKQSLKMEEKCPTCRRSLRGKTSYHPLYLQI